MIRNNRKPEQSKESRRRVSCKDLGYGECEGWMWQQKEKTSFTPKTWRKYWFKLKDQSLYCYRDPRDVVARRLFHMPAFTVSMPSSASRKFAFKITNTSFGSVLFAAKDQADMSKWMTKLELSGIFENKTVGKKLQKSETNLKDVSESEEETNEDEEKISSESLLETQDCYQAADVLTTFGPVANTESRSASPAIPELKSQVPSGSVSCGSTAISDLKSQTSQVPSESKSEVSSDSAGCVSPANIESKLDSSPPIGTVKSKTTYFSRILPKPKPKVTETQVKNVKTGNLSAATSLVPAVGVDGATTLSNDDVGSDRPKSQLETSSSLATDTATSDAKQPLPSCSSAPGSAAMSPVLKNTSETSLEDHTTAKPETAPKQIPSTPPTGALRVSPTKSSLKPAPTSETTNTAFFSEEQLSSRERKRGPPTLPKKFAPRKSSSSVTDDGNTAADTSTPMPDEQTSTSLAEAQQIAETTDNTIESTRSCSEEQFPSTEPAISTKPDDSGPPDTLSNQDEELLDDDSVSVISNNRRTLFANSPDAIFDNCFEEFGVSVVEHDRVASPANPTNEKLNDCGEDPSSRLIRLHRLLTEKTQTLKIIDKLFKKPVLTSEDLKQFCKKYQHIVAAFGEFAYSDNRASANMENES